MSVPTGPAPGAPPGADDAASAIADRHRVYGFWALLFFLGLGVLLEGLHGIKADFYLRPAHVLRRELWTLAHAHGTLLALVNLAFAASLHRAARGLTPRRLALASHLLVDGSLLVPVGFFLGGAFPTEHDPWPGVLLVPVGAVCLLVSLGWIAAGMSRARRLG